MGYGVHESEEGAEQGQRNILDVTDCECVCVCVCVCV